MASILVKDLRPAGSELLLDQESFLTELSDELTGDINGGLIFTVVISPASAQVGAAAVATFVAGVGASYVIVKNWGR